MMSKEEMLPQIIEKIKSMSDEEIKEFWTRTSAAGIPADGAENQE